VLIMLSWVFPAREHLPCGRLSGEFSPVSGRRASAVAVTAAFRLDALGRYPAMAAPALALPAFSGCHRHRNAQRDTSSTIRGNASRAAVRPASRARSIWCHSRNPMLLVSGWIARSACASTVDNAIGGPVGCRSVDLPDWVCIADAGPARRLHSLAGPTVRCRYRLDALDRDRRSSTHTVASVRTTANDASAMRLTPVPPLKVSR